MDKPKYSFTINVPQEVAEKLRQFNYRPALLIKDIDVFEGIFNILYERGFRPFVNGMAREETGCGFSWECIIEYKSVLDFQLEWPGF
jgi:hypothetical protein